MEVVFSSSHVVSAAPSSSGGGLLILLPAPRLDPSHRRQLSANFSNVSPSQGLQFFTNSYNVGPFHGVQSFRNRLLQRGSPTGSQAMPANLLWHGLLSPQVHRSWQEPAPAQASYGVTASFRHTSALAWGLPWAAGGYLLHSGPPWAAGGQPASPQSSSWAAREKISAPVSGAPPPPPSSLTLVSAELFLSDRLTLLS